MWNFNGFCTNIDDVENFLDSRFFQPSLWCSLGIVKANLLRLLSEHSSMHSNQRRTMPCMSLVTDGGNSRFVKQSSYLWFETLWHSCDVTVMKWSCPYVIQMIYSVTGMIQPLYLRITYPYGLTRLYLFHYNDVIWAPSCLKSPATRLFAHVLLLLDNKQNSQISTCCRFLRGIYRCLVDSRHKGRVVRKVFPCHDVIIYS